jgi:hypothetical protein
VSQFHCFLENNASGAPHAADRTWTCRSRHLGRKGGAVYKSPRDQPRAPWGAAQACPGWGAPEETRPSMNVSLPGCHSLPIARWVKMTHRGNH